MRIVYSALRHALLVYLDNKQVVQTHVSVPQIFQVERPLVIRFTAGNGNAFVGFPKIHSFRLRFPKLDVSQSELENKRIVGAKHDKRSFPLKFTFNARDSCGYDRPLTKRRTIPPRISPSRSCHETRKSGEAGATHVAKLGRVPTF